MSFQRISLRAAACACVVATGAFKLTLTFGVRFAGHLRQLKAQRGFATKYLGTGPPGRPQYCCHATWAEPKRSTFDPKQPPLELRRVPPLPASWRAHGSPLPSGSASCCLLQAEHADHGRRCGSFGRSTHRSINGGSHRRLPRRMNGHRPPTGPEKLRAPCCTSPRDRGNTGVTEREARRRQRTVPSPDRTVPFGSPVPRTWPDAPGTRVVRGEKTIWGGRIARVACGPVRYVP